MNMIRFSFLNLLAILTIFNGNATDDKSGNPMDALDTFYKARESALDNAWRTERSLWGLSKTLDGLEKQSTEYFSTEEYYWIYNNYLLPQDKNRLEKTLGKPLTKPLWTPSEKE